MRRRLACQALLLFSSVPLFGAPNTVSISGRKLLVNGQAFTVQGVNYSPTPVGETVQNPSTNCSGPYYWANDRATYVADFPLIQKLGANTLRTFDVMNGYQSSTSVTQALNQAQSDHLYVIMGYFVQTYAGYDLSSPANQAQIQSEVLAAVSAYKNNPAVLAWVIGNEQNLNNGNNTTWYSFLNTLAGLVKAADPNHPVGTVEGECPQGGCATTVFNVGNAAVSADDGHMTNLDFWGVNAYRGTSFQGLFQSLLSSTAKPILVSEFGKDAYRDSTGAEDQTMQASYISPQWQEIQSNLSATSAGSQDLVGGAVFEWTDEWWKDTTDDCITHGTQVAFTRSGDTVDPNYQNEWFGLAAVSPVNAISNPGGTNRSLRTSYSTLQKFWNPGAATATSGAGSYFNGTVHNYPNPFRIGIEATDFVVLVNEAGMFDIRIYDAGGQFVTSFSQDTPSPGRYAVKWDGHNRQGAYVSPGLYFAKIHGQSPSHDETQYRRVVGVK